MKIPELSAFQMAGFSLLHSMTADGKKLFLKKLFKFNQGNTINISRSITKCFFSVLNEKKIRTFKFCKTLLIFIANFRHG